MSSSRVLVTLVALALPMACSRPADEKPATPSGPRVAQATAPPAVRPIQPAATAPGTGVSGPTGVTGTVPPPPLPLGPTSLAPPPMPTGPTGPPPNPALAAELTAGEFKTLPSGIRYRDVKTGNGPALAKGMTAWMQFTGWLSDGAEFDSSDRRGGDYPYLFGAAKGVRYFNEGLEGMRVGGERRIIVPPDMAYGEAGRPPIIPPNATLVFDVELAKADPPWPAMAFPDLAKAELKTSATGLKSMDVKVGAGPGATNGDTVVVHHTGWFEDGKQFDSSLDNGVRLPIGPLGGPRVIPGLSEGLLGIQAGGRRLLVIPPALAFGERGHPGGIPANATLVYLVDAVEIQPGG